MATRFFSLSSCSMITPNHVLIKRQTSRLMVVMCANNHISVDAQIRSPHKNKVFEDRSVGIVCYRDKNGEITCEGYDEGPRFQQQLPRFSLNARNAEIIEMLERCWPQVVDENEF